MRTKLFQIGIFGFNKSFRAITKRAGNNATIASWFTIEYNIYVLGKIFQQNFFPGCVTK